MNKQLFKSVMERVETWPEAKQQELLEIVLEMEARRDHSYELTPEELAGIDRGLREAEAGRFASDKDVEAALCRCQG